MADYGERATIRTVSDASGLSWNWVTDPDPQAWFHPLPDGDAVIYYSEFEIPASVNFLDIMQSPIQFQELILSTRYFGRMYISDTDDSGENALTFLNQLSQPFARNVHVRLYNPLVPRQAQYIDMIFQWPYVEHISDRDVYIIGHGISGVDVGLRSPSQAYTFHIDVGSGLVVTPFLPQILRGWKLIFNPRPAGTTGRKIWVRPLTLGAATVFGFASNVDATTSETATVSTRWFELGTGETLAGGRVDWRDKQWIIENVSVLDRKRTLVLSLQRTITST